MRLNPILRTLGLIFMVFSFTFLICGFTGIVGILDGKGLRYFDSVTFFIRVYLSGAIITFFVGFLLWWTGNKTYLKDGDLLEREGYAVVGLVWLIVSGFGAIPFIMAEELEPIDAYFESISGFTTTGATVLTIDEVSNDTWMGSYSGDFAEKVFHNVSFVNCSFAQTTFYHVYFDDCIFINTTFRNVEFVDSYFSNCVFDNCLYGNQTINTVTSEPATFFSNIEYSNTSSDEWKEVYYPLPKSLLLWRSFTQWIGGMGIVVFTVMILSNLIGSSLQLLKVELPGIAITRLKPKMSQTAKVFIKIYSLFTLILILCLRISGMSLYDSITNAFACLSTGGYSPRAMNIEAYDSALFESILIIFMIIGTTNFVLHYHVLNGKWNKLFHNTEFRALICIILFMTSIITLILWIKTSYSLSQSFRYAIFQVVSLNTTSGFSSIGYGAWPESTRFFMLILIIIGGSSGGTSGGIKVIRLIILMKIAKREISTAIHPTRELPIVLGNKPIPENLIRVVGAFFFLYLAILVVSSGILMIMGENIMDSISSVATTMGTAGPPVGTKGPYLAFGDLHPVSKIVLILCMWLGRIEILAAFILLSPSSYKE